MGDHGDGPRGGRGCGRLEWPGFGMGRAAVPRGLVRKTLTSKVKHDDVVHAAAHGDRRIVGTGECWRA